MWSSRFEIESGKWSPWVPLTPVEKHMEPADADGLLYSERTAYICNVEPSKELLKCPIHNKEDDHCIDHVNEYGTVVFKRKEIRGIPVVEAFVVVEGKTKCPLGYKEVSRMPETAVDYMVGGLYNVSMNYKVDDHTDNYNQGVIVCHYIGRASSALMRE